MFLVRHLALALEENLSIVEVHGADADLRKLQSISEFGGAPGSGRTHCMHERPITIRAMTQGLTVCEPAVHPKISYLGMKRGQRRHVPRPLRYYCRGKQGVNINRTKKHCRCSKPARTEGKLNVSPAHENVDENLHQSTSL